MAAFSNARAMQFASSLQHPMGHAMPDPVALLHHQYMAAMAGTASVPAPSAPLKHSSAEVRPMTMASLPSRRGSAPAKEEDEDSPSSSKLENISCRSEMNGVDKPYTERTHKLKEKNRNAQRR